MSAANACESVRDVETILCYEDLRRQVLGEAGGVRHSLGWSLFVRRGMASWMQAWQPDTAPTEGGLPPRSVRSAEQVPPTSQGEVAMLLAGMALGCFAEGRR